MGKQRHAGSLLRPKETENPSLLSLRILQGYSSLDAFLAIWRRRGWFEMVSMGTLRANHAWPTRLSPFVIEANFVIKFLALCVRRRQSDRDWYAQGQQHPLQGPKQVGEVSDLPQAPQYLRIFWSTVKHDNLQHQVFFCRIFIVLKLSAKTTMVVTAYLVCCLCSLLLRTAKSTLKFQTVWVKSVVTVLWSLQSQVDVMQFGKANMLSPVL